MKGSVLKEGNPLMEALLAHSVEAFIGTKMILALNGTLRLWSARSHGLSRLALLGACGMYTFIMLVHVLWTSFPDLFCATSEDHLDIQGRFSRSR